MNPTELVAVVMGSNVITGLVTTVLTAYLTRGSAALERRVKALEDSLEKEYAEHQKTRRLLSLAVQHIRETLTWIAGPRTTDPPAVPEELLNTL